MSTNSADRFAAMLDYLRDCGWSINNTNAEAAQLIADALRAFNHDGENEADTVDTLGVVFAGIADDLRSDAELDEG